MSAQFLQRLFDPGNREQPIAFYPTGEALGVEALRGQVAGWLERLAAEPHAPCGRWALCFEDCYRFAAALFAVLLAGKEAVLPDHSRPAGLAELSQHFDGILADAPLDLPESCPVLSPPPPVAYRPRTVPDDETARLRFFTSGSTGRPKPIVKQLAQVAREVRALRSRWGGEIADAEVVSTVTHQHFYGFIFRLFLPLECGIPFAAGLLRNPDEVAANATARRVLISSPALLKRLNGAPVQEGYRTIFSAGGPLPGDVADECERLLGVRPTDILGSSENGVMATRQSRDSDTPWQSLAEVEVGSDPEGRMRVRSPYQNREGSDAEGWQVSDDRIELLPGGAFRLLGRLDRIVKIEEKRVSLSEVEQCLQALHEVEEAAVVALQGQRRIELGAVLVLTAEGQAALSARKPGTFAWTLRRGLRQRLEPVAIPRRFRFVEAIPTNPQGKRMPAELTALFA